jgi:methionyl-tRNA synthetase
VRSDRDRCATVLNVCVQALSGLSVLLAPFLPMKAEELHAMLGGEGSVHDRSWADASAPVGAGRALARPYPLIKKLEVAEVSRALGLEVMAAEASESKAPKAAAGSPAPTLDCPADALDLVIARIERVEAHPKADKLWVLQLDMGAVGKRQIVAGIRGEGLYEAADLEGRLIVVVSNLAPAKLRGVESNGMLLAAEDSATGVVSLLVPRGEAAPGDRLWSPLDAAGKGRVEFKEFTRLELRVARAAAAGGGLTVDAGAGARPGRLAEGLEPPELVAVTPDGGALRVLHTPACVLTVDRPVAPGTPVH